MQSCVHEMYSIIPLILALYRAIAESYYSVDVAGRMLNYNDCVRIADQLRQEYQIFAPNAETAYTAKVSQIQIEDHVQAVEAFGRRAYGTELDSQRTIIRDLLETAQGFSNCTTPPFAAECEAAIAMTTERIRLLFSHWKSVLSSSVLYQALGSLIAVATGKLVTDIEDMSDISEADSHKLREFCLQITALQDLFTDQDSPKDQKDLIAIYVNNWLKFQYLIEILDSSLVDIKYLWTDGELSIYFDVDEVVDLVKALFAESDHRRRAIADISRQNR
jgi:protein transport protein DSL1/ZW10